MEYYRESKESFEAFLAQCKRAMDKCGFAFGSVKSEQWSALYGNNGYDNHQNFTKFAEVTVTENMKKMEVWEGLKKFGSYQFNYPSMAIDFDFGRVVYAESWDPEERQSN